MIAIQDHAIIGSLENEFLRIEPYGPNAIRVRASMGKISDENWTLLSPETSDCKIVTQEDGSLRMKNGRIELVITADSRISFWNSEGQLLTEEYWMDERDQPARLMRGHVGGASSIELRLKPQKNEHFYGLGQDGLDVSERAAPSTSIIRIRRAPFPLWYPPVATASSGTIPRSAVQS